MLLLEISATSDKSRLFHNFIRYDRNNNNISQEDRQTWNIYILRFLDPNIYEF